MTEPKSDGRLDPVSTRVDDSDQAPNQERIAGILFKLLLEVVNRHHSEIAPALAGESAIENASPDSLSRIFQAHGIWFQLLSIVEQHAAMAERRSRAWSEQRALNTGPRPHLPVREKGAREPRPYFPSALSVTTVV